MNKICGTCTYGREKATEETVVECFLNPPALVQLNVSPDPDDIVWQRPLVDLSDTCSHWLNTR